MILDWPACRNARDLGGLPTQDGGRIRGGALLRSDHHGAMTPETVVAVRAAGVSRIVDLRRPYELAERPSPFAGDPSYAHVPLLADVTTYEHPDDSYGPLLDHNRERVAAAFRAIAEVPPGGVLVHCHSGRDRTGVLVALALTVAGVGPEVVAEDYARTEDSAPANMLNTLAHAEREYGGVEPYLVSIGIEPHHLDAVRQRLREPAFLTDTRNGWSAFAEEYAARFTDELTAKIWDRALLTGFAELVRNAPGPVLEVGSGPGVMAAKPTKPRPEHQRHRPLPADGRHRPPQPPRGPLRGRLHDRPQPAGTPPWPAWSPGTPSSTSPTRPCRRYLQSSTASWPRAPR